MAASHDLAVGGLPCFDACSTAWPGCLPHLVGQERGPLRMAPGCCEQVGERRAHVTIGGGELVLDKLGEGNVRKPAEPELLSLAVQRRCAISEDCIEDRLFGSCEEVRQSVTLMLNRRPDDRFGIRNIGNGLEFVHHHQGSAVEVFGHLVGESEQFLLETCMYFPFVTSKNLIGFGAEHSKLMRAIRRLQMILVLAVDPALESNRVLVDRDGEAVIDYTMGADVLDSLHRSMIASAKIFFAGASRVHAPAGVSFFIERSDADRVEELIPRRNVIPGKISVASAHIMGGCGMGRDASDSVTDSWGRVHGAPGLYVGDSGLFPRASEINPYVTVMALADRVAEHIREHAGELLQS